MKSRKSEVGRSVAPGCGALSCSLAVMRSCGHTVPTHFVVGIEPPPVVGASICHCTRAYSLAVIRSRRTSWSELSFRQLSEPQSVAALRRTVMLSCGYSFSSEVGWGWPGGAVGDSRVGQAERKRQIADYRKCIFL